MRYMMAITLAALVCGCAGPRPDFSDVPANVPPEAKPVWVMFAAAQKADLSRIKTVCTPAKRAEIEAADQTQRQRMFPELTQLIPDGDLNKLNLTVCRDTRDMNRLMGFADTGKNFVAREGFAMILIAGGKTGLPVTLCKGVWLIEGNRTDQKKNWIEQAP